MGTQKVQMKGVFPWLVRIEIFLVHLCLLSNILQFWWRGLENENTLSNPLTPPPPHTTCPVCSRETRKGWPLLTVETEVNGDSKSTNERGSSLDGSLCLSCQYQRFLFCLDRCSLPSTKYFFTHSTQFQLLCPHR